MSSIVGTVVLAAVLAAALAVAQTASAQQASSASADAQAVIEAALPRLEPVCYGRFYDAAHLKTHPRQKVTSVRLLRDFVSIRLESNMARGLKSGEGRTAQAQLVVTYRDGKGRFVGGASCMALDGTVRCSAGGCDAGSFRLRVEDPDSILIGDKEFGAGFTVSGGCSGGEDRSLNEGEDDRVFRLRRMPIKECR
jgi:hypothetical protein